MGQPIAEYGRFFRIHPWPDAQRGGAQFALALTDERVERFLFARTLLSVTVWRKMCLEFVSKSRLLSIYESGAYGARTGRVNRNISEIFYLR